jgi:serine/threonine-protein kinase
VRLPEQAAWYIFERLLAALAAAHGKKTDAQAVSIVHGDVSPANVLLGWDGTVKLADFGMARMRGLLHQGPQGSGTPGHMSPEQAMGQPATDRSDVFCAALVAFRMATGRTPYARERGDDAALLDAMREVRLAPLGKIRDNLPEAVTDAIGQALAPDPAARALGAEELRQVVKGAFDAERGKAELVTLLKRWREQLEKTITPWARQASLHDDDATTDEKPKAPQGTERHEDLALTLPDDAPSSPPLVSTNTPSEGALIATTGAQSMSRLGSSVPDALEVDPLPAMRITMPSIPVYGGPAVNLPVPVAKQPFFSGKVAAFFVVSMIIMLLALAVLMFRLLAPPPRPVGEAPSLLISGPPV